MKTLKPKATITCGWCFEDFEVEQWRAKRAQYCGWKCKQSAGAAAASRSRRGTGKKTLYVKRDGGHEHRIVAEQKLGRKLIAGEIVHHLDRNKRNNSPENLVVMFQPDHVREHHLEMLARRKEVAGY